LGFITKWQRFWRLSGFERGIVVETFAALAVTWLGLRLAGFGRWKSVLTRFAPALREESLAPAMIETARIISRMEASAAQNLFFRPNCLEKSMVLWWLLLGRGIPAELRFGARKEGKRFEAHAWVECGGTVLNEPQGTHLHFAPFDAPIISVKIPGRPKDLSTVKKARVARRD
jgi:Transglutaminase-like superfamily